MKLICLKTLDYLHDNNVLIPQKTFQRDEDGNIVKDANDKPIIQEGTPILAPQSGYSLTKLEAKEDGSKPDGDNVITKFEYDKTTGTLNPVYYSVNLKQTEYGHKDATNREVKYYSWGKDSKGNEVLTEGTENSHDVTYYVDKDRLSERITGNQNDANIDKDFIGNTAAPSGGAIDNWDNSTIENITGDFVGNYTSTLSSTGGAISNYGIIRNINGNFIGNYASVRGGAIDNSGTIGHITGDFVGNYTSASSNRASNGGAIYNRENGTIENITGNFIGNKAFSPSDYSGGGAIYNEGTIGNITGDFIKNEASKGSGGAIYNYDNCIIGNITGDFIGNSSSYNGGAIYNDGAISNIYGDFSKNNSSEGGAIYNHYNNGTIGNITSNFIENSAKYGGAIDNGGTISDITGDFTSNQASSEGGAIYNEGTIGDITGNFINNQANNSSYRRAIGGAIYNHGTIGNITGDFIGNYAKTERDTAQGGAIYNESTIENITSSFVGNHALTGGAIYNNGTIDHLMSNFIENYSSYGGAICNGEHSSFETKNLKKITGDFIRNHASEGGAIYNCYNGKIDNITGNFTENFAQYGGAIYNDDNGKIDNITSDFIKNYATSENEAKGGAIYINLKGKIDNITGNFIENYAKAENGTAIGGAIANNLDLISNVGPSSLEYTNDSGLTSSQNPSLLNIKNSSFINNYASGNYAYGGAIYNNVSEIVGGGANPQSLELADNTITTSDYGITLLNVQNSSFENNNVSGTISALGGAIANEFHISNRNTPQEGSLASETNTGKYNINISNSTFNNNTANSIEEIAAGGAIYNSNIDLNILGSNFTNNSAVSEQGSALGGAIAAQNPRLENSIGTIEVNYMMLTYTNSNTGESITLYGAYCQEFDEDLTLQENIDIANSQGITVNFKKEDDYSGTMDQDEWNYFFEYINEQKEKGYVSENDITQTVTINNPNTDEIILASNGDIKTIANSSFINNHATSTAGEAKGGAIYSNRDLNIVADGTTSVFKDNYTESKGVKDDNAIYIDNNATLNFTIKNNGKIYMADNIDGTVTKDSDGKITDTYNVNIKGDDINNTTFYMLNDIRNANVTFDNTTINTINNKTHVYNFNSLTVNSDTNFVADVDLANEQMDRITANTYGTHNGNLNVVGMNLLSDATKDVTEIYFAQPGLKNNVVNGMPKTGEYNLPSSAQTTFYTPIYKYNAIYDNRNDGGYFIFDRVSAGNNSGKC